MFHVLKLSVAVFALTLISAGIGIGAIQAAEPSYPPQLPDGKTFVSDSSADFLVPAETDLPEGTKIARTPPRVDFCYFPEQTYAGNPWSAWGDSLVVGEKYYAAIGDHKAPQGNAFLIEYDSNTHKMRTLASTKQVLNLPEGHYMPGKIHSRIDLGSDGWLYYSTHRGSTRVTTDQYHYTGDWILRTHPETAQTEVVVRGPVPKCCIPTSVLDPDRLIFYGGTAAGEPGDKTVTFFAYDVKQKKVRHTAVPGGDRYLMLARSTGRVYYMDEVNNRLMRYDPQSNQPPQEIAGHHIGLRAATQETPDGFIYTVGDKENHLWRFNTKTEEITDLGPLAVGTQTYTASLDADASGRFLYYVPGAHGSSQKDGSPVVQFDTQTRTKKVIAWLASFYEKKYGFLPMGTYSSAVSAKGDKLYVTWNGNCGGVDRKGKVMFNTCALTVLHLPESER